MLWQHAKKTCRSVWALREVCGCGMCVAHRAYLGSTFASLLHAACCSPAARRGFKQSVFPCCHRILVATMSAVSADDIRSRPAILQSHSRLPECPLMYDSQSMTPLKRNQSESYRTKAGRSSCSRCWTLAWTTPRMCWLTKLHLTRVSLLSR
jgi:hypothetical protein